MGLIRGLSFSLFFVTALASTGEEYPGSLEHSSNQRLAIQSEALVRFDSWWKRHATAADPGSQAQLLNEGLALVKERRTAFLKLMKVDPARALSEAVPASVRNRLPATIVDELEVPVSGMGDLLVRCAIPPLGTRTGEMLQREVHLNGRIYNALVYGRRLTETTKYNIPLHGVAVGDILVVHENVLAELDRAEELNVTEPVIDLAETDGSLADSGQARLARMGQQVYRFASRGHLQRSETLLQAAESCFQPDTLQAAQALLEKGPSPQVQQSAVDQSLLGLPAPDSKPHKKVLVIRTDFSDLPGQPRSHVSSDPLTASSVQFLANNQVGAYFQRSSYGKASVVFTVSPELYRLPQTAAYYATVSFEGQLYHDAVAAAEAHHRLADYDIIVVLFSWLGNIPGSKIQFGGLSIVGTPMVWVNGEFDFRVVAHEIGHACGLFHANLWSGGDDDPLSDNGTSIEYGDVFDTMSANWGNDQRTDFNPWFKHTLGWISEDQVQTVTSSGVYRIHRFDHGEAAGTLALKIVRDVTHNFWVGCRRNFTENLAMQHGAYVIWGYNNPRQSDLLCLGSPGNDARESALAIGDVLPDTQANLSIAPVAEGGEGPHEYVDVQISFGPPPLISAQPQNQLTFAGATAQFNVVAKGNTATGYIWQRQSQGSTTWITLSDGPDYNGTSTATLMVSGVTTSMNGDAFRCVLTNSAGGFNCTRRTFLKVDRSGVVTVAGQPGLPGLTDGSGNSAQFNSPMGLAVDGVGNCFVADSANHVIRKITPAGIVSTWAGLGGSVGSADGVGSIARFNSPAAVAVDTVGNVYVADTGNSTIRKMTPDGSVTTLAGSPGVPGSGVVVETGARFNYPGGIAADSVGNLYVTDTGNHTIRKITPEGVVSTLAGFSGTPGTTDGTGSSARFDGPAGIAVDTAQNVYVADQNNSTIRKLTPDGQVTTFAGAPRVTGSFDGTGNEARFSYPAGIAVDAEGNVYAADRNNSTIRKITPRGQVSTLAGAAGWAGNTDGACNTARFTYPSGVAMGGPGIIYVADTYSHTIRTIRMDWNSQPRLEMRFLADRVILSWSTSVSGFVLETSEVLGPGASWTPVMSPVESVGNKFVVTDRLSSASAFFRLRKP